MTAMTMKDLSQMRCGAEHEHGEECGAAGPLVINSACHLGEPTVAIYHDGEIQINCSVCETNVCRIAVKD